MDQLNRGLGLITWCSLLLFTRGDDKITKPDLGISLAMVILCDSSSDSQCPRQVTFCLSFRPAVRTIEEMTGLILTFEYSAPSGESGKPFEFHLGYSGRRLWIQSNEYMISLFQLPVTDRSSLSKIELCFTSSSNDVTSDVTVTLGERNQTVAFPRQEPRAIAISPTFDSDVIQREVMLQVYFEGGGTISSPTNSLLGCMEDVSLTVSTDERRSYQLRWNVNSISSDHSTHTCNHTCYTNTSCSISPWYCPHRSLDDEFICGGCLQDDTFAHGGCRANNEGEFSLVHWVILATFLTLTLLLTVMCMYCTVSYKKARQAAAIKQGQMTVISKTSNGDQQQGKGDSRRQSTLSGSIDMEWDPQIENRVKTPELEWDHEAHNPDICVQYMGEPSGIGVRV